MKYKNILKFAFLITVFVIGFSVTLAQSPTVIPAQGGNTTVGGQGGNNNPVSTLGNPLKASSIQQLLLDAVDIAIFVGGIFAILMLLFVGFKFVMARGNESELKEAKKWFFYAIIGTAILISSKVIVNIVQNTLTKAGVVDEKLFNLPK